MRGVSYNWRCDEFPKSNFSKDHQVGVIAQEIEKIIPEVVNTGEDGYKAVEYGHLVPILIEAIKEMNKKIEDLSSLKIENEQRIGTLEAKVEKLQTTLENRIITVKK